MLRLENISKNYGDHRALDSISFELSDKQVVGLLGPNGAGKSTSMKILSGSMGQSSGKYFLNNTEVSAQMGNTWKVKVGFLPESPPVYEDLSVLENLNFWSGILSLSSKDSKKQINYLVERVGLSANLHRSAGILSKGYKQRLGIAVALLGTPDVLVLDEPVSGLDPAQMIEIRDLIKDLGREHLVLISSHQLAELEQTCDRFLFLDNGKLVGNLKKSELEEIGARSELSVKHWGSGNLPDNQFYKVLSQETNSLRLAIVNEEQALKSLVEAMSDNGLTPKEMRWEKDNLESTFLKIMNTKESSGRAK